MCYFPRCIFFKFKKGAVDDDTIVCSLNFLYCRVKCIQEFWNVLAGIFLSSFRWFVCYLKSSTRQVSVNAIEKNQVLIYILLQWHQPRGSENHTKWPSTTTKLHQPYHLAEIR